jgi:hypothetical protein
MNTPPQGKTWTVVPYEPDDLSELAEFFKKYYTGASGYGSAELFSWKIVRNYAGPGLIRFIKDEGRIISVLSATPKWLYVMGRAQIVAELCDALTDPNYRRQGLFAVLDSQITNDVLHSGIPFVYGTPNRIALPGHEKKANYKTIPGIRLKSMVVPLGVTYLMQDKCHRQIANAASTLYSSLVSIYFLWKKYSLNPAALSMEKIDEIPEEWDDFWEEARSRFDFILARNRRAIQWRYIENPNRYRIYVLKDNGRIVTYLIYRIMHDSNVASLVVADYLCLPGREKDLMTLLFRILDDARKAGTAKINVWCPEENPCFQVFKRFGFIERSEIPVIAYQNDFARTLQESCRSWHFTVGDSDNV